MSQRPALDSTCILCSLFWFIQLVLTSFVLTLACYWVGWLVGLRIYAVRFVSTLRYQDTAIAYLSFA